MVVIDDFRKQILYQRLNLGYDCTLCKRKFYCKRDQLQHVQESHLNSPKKEQFVCPKCGKIFGHSHIYQLHLQIHALSEPESVKTTNNDAVIKDVPCSSKPKRTPPLQSSKSSNNKEKSWKKCASTSTTTKKPIGLTKIRMEDCMRCDACSCIYIDRNDYYKHMRNFHKVDCIPEIQSTTSTAEKSIPSPKTELGTSSVVQSSTSNTISPTKQVISPRKCKSCSMLCRGSEPHSLHRATRMIQSARSNEIFKFSVQDNIKDRWSKMVSQRLLETNDLHEEIKIKPDPDAMELDSSIENDMDSDEMSHLLSQVEVKIKTEPPDER